MDKYEVAELIVGTNLMDPKSVEATIKSILVGTGNEDAMKVVVGTSFFSDPASSRYHLAMVGGLALHSLLVLDSLIRLQDSLKLHKRVVGIDLQSMVRVAILHDVCKIGTYKVESRNRKNDVTGQWEKYNVYVKVSAGAGTNYGHGFGSLMRSIESGVTFTNSEKEAIIHHMGAYGETKDTGLNDSFSTNPLSLLLHQADMLSTHLLESDF
jgi:hypothetical protein